MTRIPCIALVVLALVAVNGIFASRAAADWNCETVEQTKVANDCRAKCKADNVAKNAVAACHDAYRQCRKDCPKDDGLKECNAKCEQANLACEEQDRNEFNQCLSDCLTNNGCKEN